MPQSLQELLQSSVIVVDKHAGPTSHQVSGWLREMLGLKKVGHIGTLDPAVTGVLPVLLGNSVKTMPLFTGTEKEYVGVMHLHHEVPTENLHEVVREFIGKIKQTPPKKSAVARREREREIFYFDVIEIEGKEVLFRTRTEAGTYIRKLCHDMGQRLGVGANMSELRRAKAGPFNEEQAHSLTEIKDLFEFAKAGDEERFRKILIPIEDAMPHAKKIYMKNSAISSVVKGAPLYVSGIVRSDELIAGENVAMLSEEGKLVAIGIAKMSSVEISKRKKGVAVRTDRIIRTNG